MASSVVSIEGSFGIHEEDAADVSLPSTQIASTMIGDGTIALGTFNSPSPLSAILSDSSTSLDQRASSGAPASLSASNEGRSSLVSVEDFMNSYEDIPPRILSVPQLFPRAPESQWRMFEDFFNADRYHFFDNSNNLSCYHFLRLWSLWLQRPELQTAPYHPHSFDNLPPIREFDKLPPVREDRIARVPINRTVTADDLKEDICNFQGLDWRELGTNRAWVREARRRTYIHRTNRMDNTYRSPPHIEPNGPLRVRRYMDSNGMAWAKEIPCYDNHFRFRRTFIHHRPHLAHFQLRDMISASSKNAVFYVDDSKVWSMNPQLGDRVSILDLSSWSSPDKSRGTITTVTAQHDVLLAGGWMGQYAIKSLRSEGDETYQEGGLAHTSDASINHIHTFLSRGGAIQAAISSNDCRIRILDCSSNKLVRTHSLPNPVNCSVASPDGRLRLQVGDQTEPWILDAQSGELLVRLSGHRDFGFACDWAQDGVHAATGNQDGIVQIWDSRNWSKPVQILSTELSGVRTMQFSPLGSGKRVLAMAEPADLVSVVDAETFKSKQRFEFLGEIGGLSFTPDGQRLYVGNTDNHYGGILEFERAGDGERYGLARPYPECGYSVNHGIDDDDLLLHSPQKRKRRSIGLGDVWI